MKSVHVVNPTQRDLVFALKGVDWHKLGTQLNVPQEELKRIDKECHEISRKLNEMLDYWKKNEEEPSWEKIIEALERIGCHTNLITELEYKYCASDQPVFSSVVSIDGKCKHVKRVPHDPHLLDSVDDQLSVVFSSIDILPIPNVTSYLLIGKSAQAATKSIG